MGKLTKDIVWAWIQEITGPVDYKTAYEELDIVEPANKDYLRTIIKRLRDEGRVAYVDGRHGVFRLLDTEMEKMQLTQANPLNTLDIRWPFGLEQFVKIFRKNVVIVAGSKDAGKTAWALNLMRLNMGRFNLRYLNTDMGEEELRSRIERFPDTTIEQWDEYIDMYEKAYVGPEHIDPNAINIVDFLEVHDEFYKVAKPIKELSAKLKNGILVVLIQKNVGAEEGLGGQRTLEKAKLALNLEPGKIWIRVAKNWQDGITESPKGKTWTYKLVGGAKIVNPKEI